MSKNSNLLKAKKVKNDEFYTLYKDISEELKHYKDFFRGKTVYCNCDNPYKSNFWKYFHRNFKKLGLKRLVATYMNTGFRYVLSFNGTSIESRLLSEDGDFRSEECISILKESDIIVTNPPFSLFREWVDLIMKYNKKFLVVGNIHAVGYSNIFPYIKEGVIQTGFTVPKAFIEPDGSIRKFGNIRWYTNFPIVKKCSKTEFSKRYNSQDYPEYDNYNAIEVSRVLNIPCDYEGVMGVPLTFLDIYNSDEFEILDRPSANSFLKKDKNYSTYIGYTYEGVLNGKIGTFFGPMILFNGKKVNTHYYTDGINTVHIGSCERVFIRRKKCVK